MAKKNEMGFRNDLIRECTPEQVQELIRQKSVLETLDAEIAYARIMLLLTQFSVYAQQFREFTEKRWLQFVEELARVREKLNDGFSCYSMVEKVGTAEAKKLFSLVENRAIFGVLVYNMAKYILDGGMKQEFTLKVMKNLTFQQAWEVNRLNERSYAVRNFYGKAVEIFENREFVRYIIDTFDISDTNFKGKEFVSAYANFYISLEKMSRENPEKVALLVRSEKTKVDSSTAEKKCDSIVSIPERTSTNQIESTPNLQESTPKIAPHVEIEDLLKSLRNLLNQKERASLNVIWLTEKMADAQLELRKAEEQIKKAKKDLEDAQLAVSSINAKLQEAEKEEDEASRKYEEGRELFAKEYSKMFDD